jgi:N-acetylmuramoyl-L-alanine amidase
MSGLSRLMPSDWDVRRWALAAAAFLVFSAAVLAAGRGLASGAMGEVLRVRFGGDAERTRVVVDLDKTSRGQVIQSGADGRVVVSLSGVGPARGLSGTGLGLVRGYRVAGAGAASRVELELATSAEIERRFLLPPGDGIDHYRYVIDLKATGRAPARSTPAPRLAPRPTERPLRLCVCLAKHCSHHY